jgi:hypothetical protein
MRVHKDTAQSDRRLDWDQWTALWHNMLKVQDAVQLPDAPEAYAVVDASNITGIGLKKLGWSNAYDAVVQYAGRTEIADELRKRIKRKHLVPPENFRALGQGDWLGGVALQYGETSSTKLASMLDAVGLLDLVKEMLKAKAKSKADPEVPPEIYAYQNMRRKLGLADDLSSDIRAALTVEDANAAFCKRFPRTELVMTAYNLFNYHRKHTLELLEFILAKEKS